MLLLIILAIVFLNQNYKNSTSDAYTKNEFLQNVEQGNIKSVQIYPNQETPTGKVKVILSNGETRTFNASNVEEIENILVDANIPVHLKNLEKPSVIITILPYIIGLIAIVILFSILTNQASSGGGGSKVMNFGKSRAKMTTDNARNVTFDNVAGLDEEKEELKEIVDFLKTPKKYVQVGARIPKGVILTGPPGTGKTLLAKAVAGEAGVPFFSISGSDFVEMFVGVGASRVRDLFEDAKKNAPCIVFIDEIDAVARRIGTGMGGGHDEREQTLNQLLVEMDGFGVNEGIIVMAATNRVDILDPAILRPGRFDRKVLVGRPDIKGREEILMVHAKNKPLAEDVDLKEIAQTTSGFTGADLENLLNEAAINAANDNRSFIRREDIKRSFIKIGIGKEKKSRVISEKEKRITAYHESGHAILFHKLPDVGPVYTVSIIPTGNGAAGYTMPLPDRDEMFLTKGKMIQDIIVGLAGRAAEEIVFDDVTTGASQDIKVATNTARSMITKYGFSDVVGMVNYDHDDDEVFIGRDLAHTRSYSEDIARVIDDEVKKIIDHCYSEAKRILIENREILDNCADLLIQKERIGREEFESLFPEEERSKNINEGFLGSDSSEIEESEGVVVEPNQAKEE